MASSDRLTQAFRTLIIAPFIGSAAATIAGAIVWGILITPAEPMDLGTAAWSMVFVFMMLTVDLAVVALVLLALLGAIGRFRPSLLAGPYFPTLLCMVVGGAVGAGMVLLLLEMIRVSSGLATAGTKWSIFFLVAAAGGAFTGMIIARRSAPPRIAGRHVTHQRSARQ